MPKIIRPSLGTPEGRTTAFYLTLFLTAGVATAYGGIWFAEIGLNEREIGVINAAPILVMLFLNLIVGRIADRASDWRQVIVWGSVISGLAPLGLFFARDFLSVLIVVLMFSIPNASIIPVLDAAAMRAARRRGADFGRQRAWGTVGYLVLLVVTGYLAQAFGGAVYVPLFVAVALLRAGTSLFLPRFRAPDDDRANRSTARLREVLKPWFVLPLVGFAILFASHLILNAFQGLLLSRQGIGPGTIGVLIALGAGSEALMFYVFGRFSHRLPARVFILLSGIVTVLRWTAFGFEPGVPVLIGLQLLHGITYGLGFMACVSFISNWTHEDIAAEAQSFFTVLQQGTSFLALLVFGWLIGLWGAQAYFASAAFAASGVLCVWLSLRMQPPTGTALTSDPS